MLFVGECGPDAQGLISGISDRYVYWPDWLLCYPSDGFVCDIEFNGKKYLNFSEYLLVRSYGEEDAYDYL